MRSSSKSVVKSLKSFSDLSQSFVDSDDEEEKSGDKVKGTVVRSGPLLKVMLVNDEFIQLSMLEHHVKRVFNGMNIETFTGNNGAEAVKEIKRNLKEIVRHERNKARKQRGEKGDDSAIDSQVESNNEGAGEKSTGVPTHYNLIILDLNMPIMGGKEAC